MGLSGQGIFLQTPVVPPKSSSPFHLASLFSLSSIMELITSLLPLLHALALEIQAGAILESVMFPSIKAGFPFSALRSVFRSPLHTTLRQSEKFLR